MVLWPDWPKGLREKVESFLTGARDDGLVGEVVLLQSAHRKQDVVGIVYD
jgi:hypothetical protein